MCEIRNAGGNAFVCVSTYVPLSGSTTPESPCVSVSSFVRGQVCQDSAGSGLAAVRLGVWRLPSGLSLRSSETVGGMSHVCHF